MNNVRNVVVTGIPRSGTTLTAALIDSLDDAVCLSEPAWQDSWPREMAGRHTYAKRVCDDFERVRGILQSGGAVPDRRRRDGSAVCNYFPRDSAEGDSGAYAISPFSRSGLSGNFLLGMKHNAHYACILCELVEQPAFAVVAVIRHPVPTILSWRSLDLPVSQGRMPAGERFWPELAAVPESTDDILLRQVLIYRLFCERFLLLRPRIKLLRYEDIVADPSILGNSFGRGYVRKIEIERREPTFTDDTQTQQIRAYLRRYCQIAWELYPDLDDPALDTALR